MNHIQNQLLSKFFPSINSLLKGIAFIGTLYSFSWAVLPNHGIAVPANHGIEVLDYTLTDSLRDTMIGMAHHLWFGNRLEDSTPSKKVIFWMRIRGDSSLIEPLRSGKPLFIRHKWTRTSGYQQSSDLSLITTTGFKGMTRADTLGQVRRLIKELKEKGTVELTIWSEQGLDISGRWRIRAVFLDNQPVLKSPFSKIVEPVEKNITIINQ